MPRLFRSLLVVAAVLAGMSRVAVAQVVRGTVVDAGNVPVPGVVVQLVDSANMVAARSLSDVRGEFRLAARPGTWTVRTLRIGYRPAASLPFTVGAREEVTRRIELAGIPVALSSVRIDGKSVCGRSARDSTTAAVAAWEQVRTAIAATQLSMTLRGVTATTVAFDRVLDPTGRTVVKQTAAIRTDVVKQPWAERSPERLRTEGYVIDEGTSGTTYYAPGLELLGADAFLEDHCLRIVQTNDAKRLAIAFEPTPARREIAEVRGTVLLDRASSELRSLDFRYANVLPEQQQAAGGTMAFARLGDGSWAISRWSIRMPVLVQLLRTQALGGSQVSVQEIRMTGGELVTVRNGRDTLWTRTPLALAGILRDSASGDAAAGARVSLRGTEFGAVADARGRFVIPGLLPGEYFLHVRTASLDSVGAVHETPVSFTDSGTVVEIRVPTARQIASAVCGFGRGAGPTNGRGVVLGRAVTRGDTAAPHNLKVVAEWTDVTVRSAGGAPSVDRTLRWLDARVEALGTFRLCGVPVNTAITIRASADSSTAQPTEVRVAPDAQFARAELVLESSRPGIAAFAGNVVDSGDVRITNAEVLLPELNLGTVTSERGEFRLPAVPAGTHHVVVRKIGFGPLDATVEFAPNRTTAKRVVLTRVTTLADVRVEGQSDRLPSSFHDHQKLGLGHFLARDDLAKQEGQRLSAILTTVPGLGIAGGRNGQGWIMGKRVPPPFRTPRRGDPEAMIYLPDNFEAAAGMPAACYARVYLDKMLLNRENPAAPFDVNSIAPSRIEAIEFFAGPSQTPIEYSDVNSSCGILVIHTRRSP